MGVARKTLWRRLEVALTNLEDLKSADGHEKLFRKAIGCAERAKRAREITSGNLINHFEFDREYDEDLFQTFVAVVAR